MQIQQGPLTRPELMPLVAGNAVDMDQLETLVQTPDRLANAFQGLWDSLFDLAKDLKDAFIPAEKRDLARAAIGLQTIENFLKGKIAVVQAHLEIKAHLPGKTREDYQELIEICIQLYHAWTVSRGPDKSRR